MTFLLQQNLDKAEDSSDKDEFSKDYIRGHYFQMVNYLLEKNTRFGGISRIELLTIEGDDKIHKYQLIGKEIVKAVRKLALATGLDPSLATGARDAALAVDARTRQNDCNCYGGTFALDKYNTTQPLLFSIE